jgi:preprotein translocase subunit SecA
METKEDVDVGGGTKTKSSITYQNFFTLYPKLAGMTGTAKTTEKEFKDIYNLNVLVLPTAKELKRLDLPDLVYQNELSKWKAVLNQSKTCFEKEQPILIGTASVEKSEFLSDLFKISNIPHQILNAKPENIKRESEIVAQAGKRKAVTIATNMAGRGTDIILGGNLEFKVKQMLIEIILEKKTYAELKKEEIEKFSINIFQEYANEENKLENDIKNLPYSLEEAFESVKKIYKYLYNQTYPIWEQENKKVKELGGLFVLGTERHETRRIDNQLRGRAGRQGDPGASQFFISLEDELIKIFGGDSIRKWVEFLIQDPEVPLESKILTNSLEEAQKKVELYNFELRKNVFQYDEILNKQRKQLFSARNEILIKNDLEKLFLILSEISIDEKLLLLKKLVKQDINSEIEDLIGYYSTFYKSIKSKDFYKEAWITEDLRLARTNIYSKGFLKLTETTSILKILDFFWTEHIERMGYIRETINWSAYGQQNPLLEYNNQAFNSFKTMFEEIRNSMLYYFINKRISSL